MPMLKEVLVGILDAREIEDLTSSFDVIGDIAIIKIPDSLESKEVLIAEQILARMKNVNTVLKQTSDVLGEYRIREVKFVAGEEKYETIYRESNCALRVNVRSVYFSPRLSTERIRIASLVQSGEKIFNMFAGLGTFSFVIAKTKESAIDSVDKNPEAIRLALETLKLNRRMKGTVRPILADAREFAARNRGSYNRILMPLPERAPEFVDSALESASHGAMIHYYVHVPLSDYKDGRWIHNHLDGVIQGRAEYSVNNWKRVREVGPRYVQAVADIRLK